MEKKLSFKITQLNWQINNVKQLGEKRKVFIKIEGVYSNK